MCALGWAPQGRRNPRKLLEMEASRLPGKGGEAQPCRQDPTARFRCRHLPRAPWQMSVRVAPPIINCGSLQISWERDPQSAVKPPSTCFWG